MLKKYPLAQYITWLVLLFALPLPLVLLLNQNLVDTAANLLIFDAGLVAYVWWLAIVYLSTRPRWLDRLIGLPAIYFIHALTGVMALAAAFLHRQLAFSMHEEIRLTGEAAFYIALFGILYASFFMSGWLVDRFPLAHSLKVRLQILFKHQLSVWVHRLHFAAIALIWLHVHLIPRILNLTSFIIVFNLYTIVSLGIYTYHHFIRLADAKLFGKVVENSPLSETVQSLSIELPEHAAYRAGDCYFLRFKGKGISSEPHPFSVASAPSQSPHQVRFMIQAVGDFTKKVPQIPLGTQVHLEGPFGRFAALIEENEKAPLVLYGLGSGIAPLLSLAQEYQNRSVHIIWSAKSETEFYLDKTFKEMAEQDNITYHGKPHRFSKEELSMILTAAEKEGAHFFVVGSASVLLKVERTLLELGVSPDRIHDERLTI